MIGVVLVLTAVGGLVARSIYQPAANAATPPAAAPPLSAVAPTSGLVAQDPNSNQVKLSVDAASSPYGTAVLNLLQAYYKSINDYSYLEWESTVTPTLIQANPQESWESSYSTTKDSGMYVYRVNSAPGGQLRVLITFTSHQDLSKAPKTAQFGCIDWHSVLTMANTRSGWKIDNGAAGGHPITQECPSS